MKIVEELYESWLNGNKKHVIEQIFKLKKTKAIIVSIYLYDKFDDYNKGVFGRMLESRL